MRETSTRACEPLFVAAASEGISTKDLVAGISVDLEIWSDPKAWVDWDQFVDLVERYEELCGDVDGLERAGAESIYAPSIAASYKVTREFRTVRQLFELGGRMRTAAYYTNFSRSFDVLEDDRYQIVHQIPRSYRGSEAVFQLHAGMIRATPQLLGRPDAVVEAEITPHRAIYRVTPPRDRITTRLRSILGGRGRLDHTLRLLVRNQETLARQRGASYAQFGTAGSMARSEMDAVGTPLMVVDVWGENELRIVGMNRMMEIHTRIQDRNAAGRLLQDVFGIEEAALLVGLHWRCIGERAAIYHDGFLDGQNLRTSLVPVVGASGDVVRVITSRVALPSADSQPVRVSA